VAWAEVYLADRCKDPIARMCPFGQVCGLTSCESEERTVTDARPDRDASLDAPRDAVIAPDAADATDVTDAMDATDAGAPRDVPLCPDGRVPVAEVCYNGVDDNCDGRTDEGCAQRSCTSATAPGCGEAIVPFVVDGFEMGEVGTTAASPTVRVQTSSFMIDRYEVTLGRFRAFWSAGHPAPPTRTVDYAGGAVTLPSWPVDPPVMYLGASDAALPECVWADASASPLAPINCVPWTTAMAFCVWDGGHLPTEAEWEAAARFSPAFGLDGRPAPAGRRYPWGNDPPTCQANFAERSLSCGPRPGAQWPVGTAQPSTWTLFDMAGNAQEWTADVFAAYGAAPCWAAGTARNPICLTVTGDPMSEERTVRGGSTTSLEPGIRGASRDHARPANNGPNKGFRCVRVGT
jgi:sulfatase modifying factor 1